MRRINSNWIAWGIVALFLFGWELTVRLARIPIYLLPAPSRVLRTLWENPAIYATATLYTLGEALAGLLIGILAGTLIACLLTLMPGIEDGVMTLAILVKSTPMVAIAPLLTIWLGFGILPKIIITALLTFFPVLVNVLSGLQRVDAALLDLFSSWNANRWEVFKYLRGPSALPYIFAALKISAPLALIGAVVAEWTGASGGLGQSMWLAYANLNLPFLFAAIFILAAIGMLLYRTSVWLERKSIFWQATEKSQL
ncbi:MAG TPA: ABC transporter permease [Bellilinea sp.]|jgi:NitT/TauT family transport system permease protein|nr:ABC transporter permease [Bellilinea sp.]